MAVRYFGNADPDPSLEMRGPCGIDMRRSRLERRVAECPTFSRDRR
jgi:hypothetical protein